VKCTQQLTLTKQSSFSLSLLIYLVKDAKLIPNVITKANLQTLFDKFDFPFIVVGYSNEVGSSPALAELTECMTLRSNTFEINVRSRDDLLPPSLQESEPDSIPCAQSIVFYYPERNAPFEGGPRRYLKDTVVANASGGEASSCMIM
jgi:hypothetical protein